MYAFTDQAIARAILNAANRGVQVRIYRDRGQYEQEQRNPYIVTLFRNSSNIHIRVKNSHELMHLKSWSDGTVLREGSSNWSPSGEKRQQNSLLFIRDSTLSTSLKPPSIPFGNSQATTSSSDGPKIGYARSVIVICSAASNWEASPPHRLGFHSRSGSFEEPADTIFYLDTIPADRNHPMAARN